MWICQNLLLLVGLSFRNFVSPNEAATVLCRFWLGLIPLLLFLIWFRTWSLLTVTKYKIPAYMGAPLCLYCGYADTYEDGIAAVAHVMAGGLALLAVALIVICG